MILLHVDITVSCRTYSMLENKSKTAATGSVVFLFNSSTLYHIFSVKSPFTSRDDKFENLGETNALACEMFFRLPSVACLKSHYSLRSRWRDIRELKQTRRRRKRERHLKMWFRVSAIIFQLFKVILLEKCVLTILELNWNQRLGQ